jgi:hypothetical protein
MFTSAFDPAHGAVLWLFSGGENTDEDFERYLESVRRLAQRVEGRDAPAAIQIVDGDNPPPSAKWRKRIAEETADMGEGALFALVSPSPLVRGVVTAINWFRQPSYEVRTFSSFGDAVAWIEQRRGRRISAFETLLAEAREQAGAGSSR